MPHDLTYGNHNINHSTKTVLSVRNLKTVRKTHLILEYPQVYSKSRRGTKIILFKREHHKYGSYFFRFRRKVNETSVMTFSSFKGPIQSQIDEKK